jgi:hypothetical protein
MFRPSEYLIGSLSQKTVFYTDNNHNQILDSQDTIKKEIVNASKDTDNFQKVSKEIQSTS